MKPHRQFPDRANFPGYPLTRSGQGEYQRDDCPEFERHAMLMLLAIVGAMFGAAIVCAIH